MKLKKVGKKWNQSIMKKRFKYYRIKATDLLKELFPEEIISKKNLFQIINDFYKNLEVKYKGAVVKNSE